MIHRVVFRGLAALAAVILVVVLGVAALYAVKASGPQPNGNPGTSSGFRYELEPVLTVLAVGEPIHANWVSHPDPNFSSSTDVTLCFAFFGPWPDAVTLKKEMAAFRAAECPISGAAVASDVVRISSGVAGRLNADAPGLSLPGLYNLRQVNIARASSGGISVASDRVIEVRVR